MKQRGNASSNACATHPDWKKWASAQVKETACEQYPLHLMQTSSLNLERGCDKCKLVDAIEWSMQHMKTDIMSFDKMFLILMPFLGGGGGGGGCFAFTVSTVFVPFSIVWCLLVQHASNTITVNTFTHSCILLSKNNFNNAVYISTSIQTTVNTASGYWFRSVFPLFFHRHTSTSHIHVVFILLTDTSDRWATGVA